MKLIYLLTLIIYLPYSFAKEDSIIIHASKEKPLGVVSHSFSLKTDTIFWNVKHISENAMACTAYTAADGSRGNLKDGWCKDLKDFTVMKDISNDKKEWSYDGKSKSWTLVQKLSENKYYIPGTYHMYWHFPETKMTKQFNYTITP